MRWHCPQAGNKRSPIYIFIFILVAEWGKYEQPQLDALTWDLGCCVFC
jgi:hypothetical protein